MRYPASRSAPAHRYAIVTAGVREYRDRMRRAAGMGTLGAWYDQLEAGMLLNLGFSAAYADQNERDFEAFTEAVGSGRLTARTGL